MQNLKNRTRFPSTIENKNISQLRDLSQRTSIPMSRLMDEALHLLFEKRDPSFIGANTAAKPHSEPSQRP